MIDERTNEDGNPIQRSKKMTIRKNLTKETIQILEMNEKSGVHVCNVM